MAVLCGSFYDERVERAEETSSGTPAATAAAEFAPFTGRQREMHALGRAWDRAKADSRQVLLIQGDPGIGKTRLVTEFAAILREESATVVAGHCDEDLLIPYRPFVEVLQRYLPACPEVVLAAQPVAFSGSLLRLVPELKDRLPDWPVPPVDDANFERFRLFEAVSNLLTTGAHSAPLAVVLEDMHWADQPSLLLLKHLARFREEGPLLIIVTYREADLTAEHGLSAVLTDLRRESSVMSLDLKGLDPEETHALVTAMAGHTPSASLAEAIHEHTEGNPFFVGEVVRSLSESGALTVEAAPTGALAMPKGVADVIGRRLGRLSEATLSTLRLASVLGREFDYATLVEASDNGADVVIEAVEEGLRARLLQERRGPEARYWFSHALVRQALYEGISTPRRQRLHQRVAHVLEAQAAANSAGRAAELALHFSRSAERGDLEKAVHYAEVAAENAMHLPAHGEAARLLEQAIEIQRALEPNDLLRTYELTLRLGEAAVAEGDGQRVLTDIAPRVLLLAEALGDARRAFAACRLVLDVTNNVPLGEWMEVGDRYAGDDPEARSRLNTPKSAVALHAGRFSEARALLLEALTLARQAGLSELAFRNATFLLRIGVMSDGEERQLFREILALPRQGVPTLGLATLHFDAVATHLQWGARLEAEDQRRQLAALARETAHHQAALHSTGAEALFAKLDGRLGDAMEACTRCVAGGLGTFPHAWRARVAAWRGDQTVLEEELRWLPRIAASVYEPAYRALFLIYLGRLNEARQALSVAVQRVSGSSPDNRVAYSMFNLMLEPAVLCGDEQAAAILLDRMAADTRKLGKPNFVVVPRHLGGAAALLGRYDEALGHYEDAMDFCQRVGYRPELALTRMDLARLLLGHLPDERQRALDYLDQAIAEFEAMGMPSALAAARQLAAGTQARARSRLGLSRRQEEVLRLIAAGRTTREIADQLVLSERTVERHIADVYAKIGARNRAEATVYAMEHSPK